MLQLSYCKYSCSSIHMWTVVSWKLFRIVSIHSATYF